MVIKIILPKWVNKKWMQKIVGSIFSCYSFLIKKNNFSRQLKNRHYELWRNDDDLCDSPEKCEATLIKSNVHISEINCCSRWQRKLTNKLNAKYFANGLGVQVAKLYWYGDDPKQIPFNKLPNNYVIKTTVGSCSNQVLVMIDNKNLLANKVMTNDEIVDFFLNLKLKKEFQASFIIVEEYIESFKKETIPDDYKLWCFHGKALFIQIINRNENTQIWYTRGWQLLGDQINIAKMNGKEVSKPDNLNKIIETGDFLSRVYNYPFVRIDLYNAPSGVYFGEFTAIPWGGFSRRLYTPFANFVFANLWKGTNK